VSHNGVLEGGSAHAFEPPLNDHRHCILLALMLSFVLGCRTAPNRQPTAGPGANAVDSWTGLYAPAPVEGQDRLPTFGIAVVLARGSGEYWVFHAGYLLAAHEQGDALVISPRPPLDDCPYGQRECAPPIARLERAPGGVRIGQTLLPEHESASFLRALRPGFSLTGVGESSRLRYDKGTLTLEQQTDDPTRSRCRAGVVIPDLHLPAVQADGYSARAISLAFDHVLSDYPCGSIDPGSYHIARVISGIALVSDGTGRVIGAYLIGYMYELLLAAEPIPPRLDLAKIARLGARALGAHPGASAE
jgi:hypothetical protein